MTRRLRISLIIISMLFFSTPLSAAKLYKWVDEEGTVHYTDKVPAQHAKKAHTRFNDRGLAVEKLDAAKTPEEIAKEKQIEHLRAEQQKLMNEQRTQDQVLLRTFRTEDDIILTRDGKLASYDNKIRFTHQDIIRYKKHLEERQQKAAELERQGNKSPDKLIKEIKDLQQQIKDSYASIIRKEKDRDYIETRFNNDLKRFRELKRIKESELAETDQKKRSDNVIILVETAITCRVGENCQTLWEKARNYAHQHATTPFRDEAQRILMSSPPVKNDDISITASRISSENENEDIIFLDLQCKGNEKGEAFCRSEKVNNIRNNFRHSVLQDG